MPIKDGNAQLIALNILHINQTFNKDPGAERLASRLVINPDKPHHYFGRNSDSPGAFSITFARKSKRLKVNGGR